MAACVPSLSRGDEGVPAGGPWRDFSPFLTSRLKRTKAVIWLDRGRAAGHGDRECRSGASARWRIMRLTNDRQIGSVG